MGSLSAPPNQDGRAGSVAAYANSGELVLAFARAGCRTVLAVRYVIVAGPLRGDPWPRVTAAMATLLMTLAFSIWTARRARQGTFTAPVHTVSAVLDQVLCACSLLPNALWPDGAYRGLLVLPEVGFLPLLVFASALRLVGTAVIGSTLAGVAALLGLVAVDAAHNAIHVAYRARDVQMEALVIAVAGTTAWIAASAMRRALGGLAGATSVVSRGRRHLQEVLREHHDIRTMLSAARLHLDLVGQHAAGDPRAAMSAAAAAVAGVADAVEVIRRRTLSELLTGEAPQPVDLQAVATGAIEVVRARFPGVAMDCHVPPDAARVAVNGGQRALVHVLMNLLVNACEGDGGHGATRVTLTASADDDRAGYLRVDIADDGPGFPAAVLAAHQPGGLTTKSGGSGLGLALLAGVIEASGGAIRARNQHAGGAQVSVWLRQAIGAAKDSQSSTLASRSGGSMPHLNGR